MVERESPTWRAIAKHLEDQQKRALARLVTAGLDPAATEFERGRLAALAEIEALANPREQILVEKAEYFV